MQRRRFAATAGGAALAPLLGVGGAVARLPPPIDPRSVPYRVFFEPGLTEISAKGHAVLQQVAEAFKGGPSCQACQGGEWQGQLFVCGHTDLAEPAATGLALSRSRSEAVLQRLALLGVPQDRMVALAYGREKLLAETAPGVADPRNRRVEIFFNRPA